MAFNDEQIVSLQAPIKSKTGEELRAMEVSRFWSMVAVTERVTDCWLWRGDIAGGYGRFSHGAGSSRAHRFAWGLTHGCPPGDDVVRHVCDNPLCVNPAHLRIGTFADNTRDMFERGRNPDRQGEKHPLAKMTAEKVREIRSMAARGHTQKAIANKFYISRSQVGKIVSRRNWRHV